MDTMLSPYARAAAPEAALRLRKQLLRDIYYRVPLPGPDAAALGEYYGYRMASNVFQIFILRVLQGNSAEHPAPLALLLQVESQLRSELAPVFAELETAVLDGRIVCLFNITSHRDAPETEQFKLAIGRFFAGLGARFPGCAFVLAEGDPAERAEDLDACMRSALTAMEYGAVGGLNRRYDSYEQPRAPAAQAALTGAQEARLRRPVETQDLPALGRFVDEILSESAPRAEEYPPLAYALPHRLLDLTADAVAACTGDRAAAQDIAARARARVDDSLDLAAIRRLTTDGVLALASELARCPAGLSPAVLRTQAHLRAHFSEPQPLPALAARVHLNPQYLSTLFKAQTGQTISDYLALLRLSHACTLLRTTDAPIDAVASASGYPDPRYFTRRFRKFFGQTPLAYRKSARGGAKNA